MGGFFAGILKWLLGKLFGNPSAPSAEAVAAKDDGAQEQLAKSAFHDADAQASMAKAVVNAPADKAGVVGELDKGSF